MECHKLGGGTPGNQGSAAKQGETPSNQGRAANEEGKPQVIKGEQGSAQDTLSGD